MRPRVVLPILGTLLLLWSLRPTQKAPVTHQPQPQPAMPSTPTPPPPIVQAEAHEVEAQRMAEKPVASLVQPVGEHAAPTNELREISLTLSVGKFGNGK